MSEDDIQVVVNSHTAWGKADHTTDALVKMLKHWNSTFQDTEVLQIVHYRGELHKMSLFGHVEADEIVEAKAVEVDGDRLERLAEQLGDIDRLAEDILEDATEVEDEDDQ